MFGVQKTNLKPMKKIPGPIVMAFSMIVIFASCKKDEVPITKPPVVDAGNSSSIKVNDDSVLLTSTISESEGQITSYLWRKLTGEGSPVFSTPNAASTWVKNLTTGNYVFQIMVEDEKGNIGSDTVSVEVIANDTVIFAAAPANNVNEVHLFGNATIDQTDTIAPELLGGSGTYLGDPVDIRALLKFDLSTIPSEARIVSAKLTLFSNPTPLNGIGGTPNYGTNNALLIQRVAETWMYNTVTWLYQPAGSTTDQIEIPHTDEPTLDLVDLDVKKLVDAMRSEGNNGFLIRLQTEEIYNFRIFCSSKYSDATKHPKLDIVYTK